MDPLFFQPVHLHHSAPTASQLILEQKCGIKTLLTKHAETKVITANDEKQRQTFIARSSDSRRPKKIKLSKIAYEHIYAAIRRSRSK